MPVSSRGLDLAADSVCGRDDYIFRIAANKSKKTSEESARIP
jgi:hypothetical protein